jgi:hypothetical protein
MVIADALLAFTISAGVYDRRGALVRTLERPVPAVGDHFGAAIASFRNRLLIGAPRQDENDPGWVFAYRRVD